MPKLILVLMLVGLPLVLRSVGLLLPEPLEALGCGWWDRIARSIQRAEFDFAGITTGLVLGVFLVVLLHVVADTNRPPTATPWRLRWTFALSAAVVLMFVAGLFGVGLFRTLQWYVEYRP